MTDPIKRSALIMLNDLVDTATEIRRLIQSGDFFGDELGVLEDDLTSTTELVESMKVAIKYAKEGDWWDVPDTLY